MHALIPIAPPTEDDKKERGRGREGETNKLWTKLFHAVWCRPPASSPTYAVFPPTCHYSPNSCLLSSNIMSHSSLSGCHKFPANTCDYIINNSNLTRGKEALWAEMRGKEKMMVAKDYSIFMWIVHKLFACTHICKDTVILVKRVSLITIKGLFSLQVVVVELWGYKQAAGWHHTHWENHVSPDFWIFQMNWRIRC